MSVLDDLLASLPTEEIALRDVRVGPRHSETPTHLTATASSVGPAEC